MKSQDGNSQEHVKQPNKNVQTVMMPIRTTSWGAVFRLMYPRYTVVVLLGRGVRVAVVPIIMLSLGESSDLMVLKMETEVRVMVVPIMLLLGGSLDPMEAPMEAMDRIGEIILRIQGRGECGSCGVLQ